MTKGYDSLNDTFNTDGSVEVNSIVKADEVTKVDEVIDTQDDLLIEPGDDFGFTETSSFFGDAKEFSPTRKVDI